MGELINLNPADVAYTASTWLLPVLIAITFHEAAHGYVAWRLGDDTAYSRGRVTFNPLRHVDPFGTVVLPILLFLSPAPFIFGWAKPVPVAFHRLHWPRRDMVLVAAAGPGMNLALAVAAALLLNLTVFTPASLGQWLNLNLAHAIVINLLLAVFNMLPLPPLDGGRVAVGLLPRQLAIPLARLERVGLLIVIVAIVLLPFVGNKLGFHVNVFEWLILRPVEWMLPYFLMLSGLA
jgi:Zn-dependent protease